MKVINSAFFNEAIRFISYGASLGWHERNAGNISLRLNGDEVDSVIEDFEFSREWVALAEAVPNMANEYIFTTVSGSYFIDIQNASETKFCICEISGDGKSYRVVWGGTKPTSELSGHLLSLEVLKMRNAGRAVDHSHPANIIALSYVIDCDDKSVSDTLWGCETECPFVFPEGIGVVGFYIPGTIQLARATAEKVKDYNAVLWSFHGIFATGDSISSAFGLAHAIEKAAEIKIKILSSNLPIRNVISRQEQCATAEHYGFKLNEF